MSYKKKTFWSDEAHIHFHRNKGQVIGGYYFRAFELVKFMKLVEEEEGEVVGLEFEDNNVNVIIKANEEEKIKQQKSQILGQKQVK